MSINLRVPKPDEMEAYYLLRYQVLRQPWGQLKGTEQSADDVVAYHVGAYDLSDNLLGVGRLHLNSSQQSQIRYMAVAVLAQDKGVGGQIMHHLEDKARSQGATEMILHARQNAVPFYERLGYNIKAKSYLLFDEIQHWEMSKTL